MDAKKDVVVENAAEVKADAAAEKKVAKKPVAKKPAEKPVAEKKVAKKVEKAEKPVAEKKVAKKAEKAEKPAAEKKTAKKAAAAKAEVFVQFAGKSFSQEELVKIAKDVWVYDMNQKEADFKAVSIYVKPEENKAYFVVNGEFSGAFDL